MTGSHALSLLSHWPLSWVACCPQLWLLPDQAPFLHRTVLSHLPYEKLSQAPQLYAVASSRKPTSRGPAALELS